MRWTTVYRDGTSINRCKRSAPIYDNLFSESFGTIIPPVLFYKITKRIPSVHKFHKVNKVAHNIIVRNNKCSLINQYNRRDRYGDRITYKLYFIKKHKMLIDFEFSEDDGVDICQINIYYHSSLIPNEIIREINTNYFEPKQTDKNKISLIVKELGRLTTSEYTIKTDEVNIGLNYGHGFIPIYNKIVETLNQDQGKGVVLFHGIPGSGKTSLIKHIASNLSKHVIFVPPYMGESLCSPDFIPFLLQYKNSILIIEDAERIISTRNSSGFSEGVSSILNITDGILGDCLNIQIICTFNTDKSRIDDALLRKGRLIAEYKFGKLSTLDSNKLLTHLGYEHRATEEMSLADIYNIQESTFVSEKNESVGFKYK